MRLGLLLWVSLLGGNFALAHDVNAEFSQRCAFELSDNVFARYTGGPFPYDQLKTEHFEPAFEYALSIAQERVAAIKNDPAKPTFENTVEKIEFISEQMDRVVDVMEAIQAMSSTPELEKIVKRVLAKQQDFVNDLKFDSVLAERVQRVAARGPLNRLTDEEKMLLKNTERFFVSVSDEQKSRLKEIDKELIDTAEDFKAKLRKQIQDTYFEITDPADLAGLPQADIDAARMAAKQRFRPWSWVITLNAPSVGPFLEYADNREWREKIYKALQTRNTTGEYDNRENIIKLVSLRKEKAEILGEENFASYQLRDMMAKDVKTVNEFLNKLADAYREPAKKEVAELKALAGHEIEAWDVAYYEAKLRQQKYDLDESALQPYFEFDNVLKGAFFAAKKAYGVEFKPANIPVWHETVRAFEVLSRTGEFLGYYYFDPFPRKGKSAGAWNTRILNGGYHNGVLERPHVVNVGNFTPPTNPAEPALLRPDEVRTVFHELGHGLHNLLSKLRYRSMFGSTVARDFVELPSQLNEFFRLEPEVLEVYARHYKIKDENGEGVRLPENEIQKMIDSENVGVALLGMNQVFYSRLDIDYYSVPMNGRTVDQFEADVRRDYEIIPKPYALNSTSFAHIFPNGYVSRYFSYRWSDGLASDGFAQFQKNAIIDPETGRKTVFNPAFVWRYHVNILEMGGSVDPDIAYARFKGGPPDPDAMLRQQGILPKEAPVSRRGLFHRIFRR